MIVFPVVGDDSYPVSNSHFPRLAIFLVKEGPTCHDTCDRLAVASGELTLSAEWRIDLGIRANGTTLQVLATIAEMDQGPGFCISGTFYALACQAGVAASDCSARSRSGVDARKCLRGINIAGGSIEAIGSRPRRTRESELCQS